MLKRLTYIFIIYYLCSTTILANIPAGLIKVTPQNNPNCVEYFNYENELYCTTKATAKQPIDPTIIKLEPLKIQFDQRGWHLIWGKDSADMLTIEYVVMGDKLESWHELVTSQVIKNVPNDVSVKDFFNYIVGNLQKTGLDPTIVVHKETADEIIFEFRIKDPENMRQDELQLVIKQGNNIYILHYVIKQADMGEANRKAWIQNLEASSLNHS